MILYFSGTGNSEYIAKKLSEQIQDELISINEAMKTEMMSDTEANFQSEKPYIFVCPTYAWQLPRVVSDFIKKVKFTGSKEVYFLMTCGEDIGNAEKYIRTLCAEKGFTFMGVMPVVMPENYITMYSAPEKHKIEALIQEAQPIVVMASQVIRTLGTFESHKPKVTDHLKSGVVNHLFYAFSVSAKGYYATEACIGCGKCEKLCPLNNIHMDQKRPVWDNHCTQCMACICGCPVVAIEYKNKTQGKDRYWCPKDSN